MSARRIIVCDWLPPAFGAVGQYMDQRARDAARRGESVTLIGLGAEGSTQRSAIGRGSLTRIVLSAPANPKEHFVRRMLWTVSTNWRLIRETARQQRGSGACSILVTGSPPFLSYVLIVLNALLWRRELVYRITDFYPETVLAANTMRWLALTLPLFRALRHGASRIEVLGEDQRRRLRDDGVPAERIVLERDSSPVATWQVRPAPRPFGDREVVLLYSGNMGRAHEVDTFCEAYRRHVLAGSNTVRLWINGVGARVPQVTAYCRAHKLPLHVSGPVPLAELPSVLLAADAHLILLDERFWGYVLPSKVYACLEASQPILYVGPEQSDVASLSRRHAREHWRAAPGDVEACFRALEALADLGRAAPSPRKLDASGEPPRRREQDGAPSPLEPEAAHAPLPEEV